jgi:salicylate hydroxylase
MDSVSYFAGDTLEEKHIYPPGAMDNIEENLGFPYRAFHRVDLHNTLKAMALKIDGTGLEIDLKLGVKIVRVDVENAEIETDDGIVRKGDILIGADGLHFCVRKAALAFSEDTGKDEVSEDGGWDIFRWLLDTKVVEADSEFKAYLGRDDRRSFILTRGRLSVWFGTGVASKSVFN